MTYMNDEMWKEIVKIHLLTTKYCIMAEEISEDYRKFLQPLKEQKDAYEHIIKVKYCELNMDGGSIPNRDDYISDNYKSAFSHERRAFFDIADWLSIVYREQINSIFKKHSLKEILEIYPDYPKCKEFLINSTNKIVELRQDKDYENSNTNYIYEYRVLLDELGKYYSEIKKKF